HAEAGDFERAVQTQKRALTATRNAPEFVRDVITERVESCLELYEASVPLRTRQASPADVSAEWVKALLAEAKHGRAVESE
ncbi:MAG: hypothetical protein ACYTG0_42045, partial [Planctomycetota bacterium]